MDLFEKTSFNCVEGRVILSFEANYIDVLIGHNLGQLNGGIVRRIELRYFPINCRMPNTPVIITFKDYKTEEILKIELNKK